MKQRVVLKGKLKQSGPLICAVSGYLASFFPLFDSFYIDSRNHQTVHDVQTDELEAKIKEEVTIREDLQKELDSAKEYILEIVADIEESKTRLSSLLKLQAELSSKLQISTAEKSRLEAQLEKTAKTKKGMVRAIEELRRQREILHRRIEFCKDRDAMGVGERSIEVSCSTRVYTVEEITLATDNFSEQMRLSSRVYRGRINHLSVAIQMITSGNRLSEDDFQSKVAAAYFSTAKNYMFPYKPNVLKYLFAGGAFKPYPSPSSDCHDRILP